MEVLESGTPGEAPEDLPDLFTAVGPPLRPGKDELLAARLLELALQDLPRGPAQDHRTRAGLRLRKEDDPLLQVDVGPAQESDLRHPHERQGRQLSDLAEG